MNTADVACSGPDRRVDPLLAQRRWSTLEQCLVFTGQSSSNHCVNPFIPEFSIVISIHYKPRIAVAIPDL